MAAAGQQDEDNNWGFKASRKSKRPSWESRLVETGSARAHELVQRSRLDVLLATLTGIFSRVQLMGSDNGCGKENLEQEGRTEGSATFVVTKMEEDNLMEGLRYLVPVAGGDALGDAMLRAVSKVEAFVGAIDSCLFNLTGLQSFFLEEANIRSFDPPKFASDPHIIIKAWAHLYKDVGDAEGLGLAFNELLPASQALIDSVVRLPEAHARVRFMTGIWSTLTLLASGLTVTRALHKLQLVPLYIVQNLVAGMPDSAPMNQSRLIAILGNVNLAIVAISDGHGIHCEAEPDKFFLRFSNALHPIRLALAIKKYTVHAAKG